MGNFQERAGIHGNHTEIAGTIDYFNLLTTDLYYNGEYFIKY